MVQFVLNVLALLFVHTAGVEQGDSMAHISLGEHLEKKITTSRQKAISSSQAVVILI